MAALIIANANGVTGIFNGAVLHYQDNSNGYKNLDAPGVVTSLVDSHDPLGREELFVTLNNSAVWEYLYSTNLWHNTGGGLVNMIANSNGVTGISGGAVVHYQDYANGYKNLDAPGVVTSLVDSHDPLGREELFVTLNNNREVWEYLYSTNLWRDTGRALPNMNMIANSNGVTGTGADGLLYHFQDNGLWRNLGSPYYVDGMIVDSHDPYGREEIYSTLENGTVWGYVFAAGLWHNTGTTLIKMVADNNGVTSSSLLHYQDNRVGVTHLLPADVSGVVLFLPAAVVASHDPYGREELFAVDSSYNVWDYVFATGLWHKTGMRSNF